MQPVMGQLMQINNTCPCDHACMQTMMGQLARQRDMYRIMAEEAGTPTTAMSAPRTPPLSAGHQQVIPLS